MYYCSKCKQECLCPGLGVKFFDVSIKFSYPIKKMLKVLEIYLHISSVTNLLIYSTVYVIVCKCEIMFSYAVTTTPHHSWRYMAPACFVVPQLFSLVTHCCWFCSLTLSLHARETWSRKALLPPPWGLHPTNDLHYQQGTRVSEISTGGVAMGMLWWPRDALVSFPGNRRNGLATSMRSNILAISLLMVFPAIYWQYHVCRSVVST